MDVIGWGVVGRGWGLAEAEGQLRLPMEEFQEGAWRCQRERAFCWRRQDREEETGGDVGHWAPDERPENQEPGREVENLWHSGGWGGRLVGIMVGVGEQWSQEGIKWKTDRKSHWPLILFKFVALIDNVFHFLGVGGGT